MSQESRVPPFVREREMLEPFVSSLWRGAEGAADVCIRFERDSRRIGEIDRPDSPGLLAFDFEMSNSITQYCFIAERRNRVVLTYSVAVFDLGDLDLYDYLSKVGLHSSGNDFRIVEGSSAEFLARGIRGRIGFMGNVWTPNDMRGGRAEIRGLIRDLGAIARAINLGALAADQSIWFVRDKHVKAGLAPLAESRAPGVLYKETEPVWLGYAGPNLVRELARAA